MQNLGFQTALNSFNRCFDHEIYNELLGQYKIITGLHDKKNHVWSAYIGTITDKNDKFASDPKKLLIMKVQNIFRTLSDAKMILRELRILRTLSHDNIIKLHDIIPPEDPLEFDSLITVFEYAPVTLNKILKSNQFFEPENIRFILHQIISGIDYMHSKHIAHRNLTTSAICINHRGFIKITDFMMAYHFGQDDTLIIPQYYVQKWDSDQYITKLDNIEKSNLSGSDKQLQIRKLKRRYQLLTKKAISKRKYQRYWSHGIWYQPPDILLKMMAYDNYSATMTGADVWSIGAIFAELLQMQKDNISDPSARARLFHADIRFMNFVCETHRFKSSSNITYKIPNTLLLPDFYDDPMTVRTEIVGTPSKEFIAKFKDERIRIYLESLPGKLYRNFGQMFPATDAVALDLLDCLLKFESNERITVAEALKHDFFDWSDDVKSNCEQLKNNDSTLLSFDGNNMKKKEMKALLLREILKYNKHETGRFILSGAMLGYKLDVIMDGYIRKYVKPLLHVNVIIPTSVVQICCFYLYC